MRRPAFFRIIMRKKVTAQLISTLALSPATSQIQNFKPLARFVSDMIGNPEDRLSRDATHD